MELDIYAGHLRGTKTTRTLVVDSSRVVRVHASSDSKRKWDVRGFEPESWGREGVGVEMEERDGTPRTGDCPQCGRD